MACYVFYIKLMREKKWNINKSDFQLDKTLTSSSGRPFQCRKQNSLELFQNNNLEQPNLQPHCWLQIWQMFLKTENKTEIFIVARSYDRWLKVRVKVWKVLNEKVGLHLTLRILDFFSESRAKSKAESGSLLLSLSTPCPLNYQQSF